MFGTTQFHYSPTYPHEIWYTNCTPRSPQKIWSTNPRKAGPKRSRTARASNGTRDGWTALHNKKSRLYIHSLKLTAKAPENRPSQKEISSSNHWFSGAMLVAGRVYIDQIFIGGRNMNGLRMFFLFHVVNPSGSNLRGWDSKFLVLQIFFSLSLNREGPQSVLPHEKAWDVR